jgi:hypothetical protein
MTTTQTSSGLHVVRYRSYSQWQATTGVPGPGRRRPPMFLTQRGVQINNTGQSKLQPVVVLAQRVGRDTAIVINVGTTTVLLGESQAALQAGGGGFLLSPGGVYNHECEAALWAAGPPKATQFPPQRTFLSTKLDIADYFWPPSAWESLGIGS